MTRRSRRSRGCSFSLPPSARSTYENSFYLETLRGISRFCSQRQYISAVITGQDEEEVLRNMERTDGRGIMLYSRTENHIVDYLCEAGLLYVIIGKPDPLAGQTICINNDNLLAGREATEYLCALGHRRIACLGCGSAFFFSADRKSGCQPALLQHDLPSRPEESVGRSTPVQRRRNKYSFFGADALTFFIYPWWRRRSDPFPQCDPPGTHNSPGRRSWLRCPRRAAGAAGTACSSPPGRSVPSLPG